MADLPPKKEVPPERRSFLAELISELKEEESFGEVKTLHSEGFDPSGLLACCVEGVRRVGERFEQGEYYISALIMAGEIMRQCSNFLQPYLTDHKSGNIIGSVLLGTIEGDIHDLGKNIFKELLQCNGFEVTDLGVDVPAQAFVEKALECETDFVAVSCLLTTCLPALQKAVKRLKEKRALKRTTILIGGASVDQRVNEYIKADRWFPDAIQAVAFCRKKIVSGR